jgi:Icc-related predicted phosphoesterase
MSDVHYERELKTSLESTYREISQKADVLLICGDLTDYGLPEEAELAARELRVVSIPVVTVLGNHDFQSGQQAEVKRILESGNVRVLDGDVIEVAGIGFAGVKGFCGGFGRRMLEPWGEQIIKDFVEETRNEALKLETALARLKMPHRIVILHYAPIQATVEGEPLEIFPFLGCSRLEDPINRYGCDAVFHGHAHHGAPQGKTQTGIPVYNVSLSLLRKTYPDAAPYRLFQVELE